MKVTKRIQKAIDLSAKLHNKQMRRTGRLPYIVHPYSVGAILSNYTDNENVIVAGFMHDVLEDVEAYSSNDLREDFGDKVASLVLAVSENKKASDTDEMARQTWLARKTKYIEVMEGTGDQEILLISCADKMHNLQAFLEVYEEEGDRMWDAFNAPEPKVKSTLWLYRELLEIFKKKLDSSIVSEYEGIFAMAKEVFVE